MYEGCLFLLLKLNRNPSFLFKPYMTSLWRLLSLTMLISNHIYVNVKKNKNYKIKANNCMVIYQKHLCTCIQESE